MSTAPTHRTPNHRPGTAELLVQLASELGNLLSRHVALAKLELGETARRTGLGVAQIAACAPLVLVATPSSMPPRRWRWPGGSPGGGRGSGGGAQRRRRLRGVALAARSFRRPELADSVMELERTVHALAPAPPSNGQSAPGALVVTSPAPDRGPRPSPRGHRARAGRRSWTPPRLRGRQLHDIWDVRHWASRRSGLTLGIAFTAGLWLGIRRR